MYKRQDLDLGIIQFIYEAGTTAVAGNVTSKPALGSDTVPALILNIEALETTEEALDIRATESDFTIAAGDGRATALEVTFEGGDLLSIDYLADPANGEFTGNLVANITEPLPALSETSATSGAAPALGPGSLSINATLSDNIFPTNIEGFFTATLRLGVGVIPPPFEVPDVVGLSEAEAEAELEAEGFIVGEIFYVEACSVAPGTVLDQDPDAGSNLPAGSEVDLTVSQCTASSDNAIPTLSEWGMILMIALLALIGGRRIWRS